MIQWGRNMKMPGLSLNQRGTKYRVTHTMKESSIESALLRFCSPKTHRETHSTSYVKTHL